MDDYVKKTIKAYNKSPQKFIDNTQDLTPKEEIERFLTQIPENGKILDAGCGYGRDTNIFYQKGFEVEGIDLSKKLLEKAKEFYPNIRFQKMDIRKLNFSDSTFDGIWCHATLLHLNEDDIIRALKEFYRVLKRARILFASFKEGRGSKEILERFSSNDKRFYTYKTADSLKKNLEEAGFKVIDTYVINEKEKFGTDKRDLNWVHSFSKK